jgi:TM2 domain-containing membrane protein YozV
VKSQRPRPECIAVKKTWITYLLWILGGFGVLGLQRFYLGRWVTGLLWFFTGGLFFMGALVDLFLIPGMVQVENLTQRLIAQANAPGWPRSHPSPQTAA